MAKRSILLPPYLAVSPVWVAMMDSIDTLFESTDTATAQLRALRDPYPVGPAVQAAINNGVFFDTSSAEYQQDMSLLIKQLEFVGLPLSDPSYLTQAQALLLFRNAAAYWYTKGTGKIVDFINFTMGSTLVAYNMWTNDYVTFLREGNPAIGVPVTTPGGTWYPTTHVSIDIGNSSVFSGLAFKSFLSFFNDIFNYNLVLHSVANSNDLRIVSVPISASNPEGAPAALLSMDVYVEVTHFIPDTSII